MTAYVDTSALLKLYVDEPGSDEVWRAISGKPVSTCRITWAEASAALARRDREAPDSITTWAAARQHLEEDWSGFLLVEVTQGLVEKAGELATAFSLRGYDAVQLAAGAAVSAGTGQPPLFVSFDRRLNRAARLLGLELPSGALL